LEIAYLGFEKKILRRLRKNPDDVDRVFATLLRGLEQDEMKGFRGLDVETKIARLIQQAKVAKRDPANRKKTWQRLVVDGVLNADGIPYSHIREIFGHRDDEAELYQMTARFFKDEDFKVYDGDTGKIRIGMLGSDRGSIPELIAVRHYGKRIPKPRYTLGPISIGTKITRQPRVKVIAIDVKTDGQQLQRFYHQATDYQMACDEVYLATTSLLLLREGEQRLLGKVKQIKVGLIHVDATTEKCERVLVGKRGKNFRGSEKRRVVEMCDNSVGLQY
jgi:hypothetical protein